MICGNLGVMKVKGGEWGQQWEKYKGQIFKKSRRKTIE